jgi:hypothetical protein
MSVAIDQYLSEKDTIGALHQCLAEGQNSLGTLLAALHPLTSPDFYKVCADLANDSVPKPIAEGTESVIDSQPVIAEGTESVIDSHICEPVARRDNEIIMDGDVRVMMYCNWATPSDLRESWNRMTKGSYRWNSLRFVDREPADYYVVINTLPENIVLDLSRTVFFEMTPNMRERPDIWAKPDTNALLFCGTHDTHFNNNEWRISKTYSELQSEPILKDAMLDGSLSACFSDSYRTLGEIRRIDFAKFLEDKEFPVHMWGGNKFEWNDYKGSVSTYTDNSFLPYKYVLSVEDVSVNGYYSDKLIDGILSECLVFYHGAPDWREYFDSSAFIWLDLTNFETDYQKILTAIEQNLWEERLPGIRKAKKMILEDTGFCPRLEKILARN